MRFLLPAALAVALMTSNATAEGFTIIGIGLDSCGSWTAARRDRHDLGPGQWIFGYLSGMGWVAVHGVDPLNGLDGQAVLAWIDNYCRDHPLGDIASAGNAFAIVHPH